MHRDLERVVESGACKSYQEGGVLTFTSRPGLPRRNSEHREIVGGRYEVPPAQVSDLLRTGLYRCFSGMEDDGYRRLRRGEAERSAYRAGQSASIIYSFELGIRALVLLWEGCCSNWQLVLSKVCGAMELYAGISSFISVQGLDSETQLNLCHCKRNKLARRM